MKFKLDALEFKLDALEFFCLAAKKIFCRNILKIRDISLTSKNVENKKYGSAFACVPISFLRIRL